MSSFRASEAALHDEARAATGLDDFGPGEYLEGLRTLLAALDEESTLSGLGRAVVRGILVDDLAARLRSEHGFARHPESAEAPVRRPLVIIGLPRTGTTALQELIAQDPQFQGLELWLTRTPRPRPPRASWPSDPDFQDCDRRMKAIYELSPDMKSIHYMAADKVDECWHLLAQSFAHSGFMAQTRVPGYERWFTRHDLRPAYRRHRRNLQLIGHGEPERRWLLKDSTHLFGLDAFLDTYPDACVVQTHRDPALSIPSVCSLCWAARAPLNTEGSQAEFGRSTLALWEGAVLGALAVRRGRAPEQFFDLPFERFRRDPLASVARIYEHFGIELGEDALARMRAFREQNPPGKHGAHHYSLDDWDLDAGEIGERFAPYIEAFDLASSERPPAAG